MAVIDTPRDVKAEDPKLKNPTESSRDKFVAEAAGYLGAGNPNPPSHGTDAPPVGGAPHATIGTSTITFASSSADSTASAKPKASAAGGDSTSTKDASAPAGSPPPSKLDDSTYKHNPDGTYSITSKDGTAYTVTNNRIPMEPPTVTTKDKDGKPVEVDPATAKKIADEVHVLSNKEDWLSTMKATPLNPKQQDAVSKIEAALKSGDLPTIKSVAEEFSKDPSKFDAVFTHVLGSTVLDNMKSTYLSWSGSEFTVTYGGGAPNLRVHLGQ